MKSITISALLAESQFDRRQRFRENRAKGSLKFILWLSPVPATIRPVQGRFARVIMPTRRFRSPAPQEMDCHENNRNPRGFVQWPKIGG